MKFLIVGCGGTGGAIGSFLADVGEDVTFLARGKQLEALKSDGIKVKSDIKGNFHVKDIKAVAADELSGTFDVVFVCVKGYSLMEIMPIIDKVSDENTIVIPILNLFGTADKLSEGIKNAKILDGCIYISSFISSPGEIVQPGKVFRVVFGCQKGGSVSAKALQNVKEVLDNARIEGVISDNISRDTFKKFAFISPFAAAGSFFNANAGDFQKDGEKRNLFMSLINEIIEIGKKMGISISDNLAEENLKLVSNFVPETTTSLQKDLMANKDSEMDTLVFEVVRLGEKYGVSTPSYNMVAEKFR